MIPADLSDLAKLKLQDAGIKDTRKEIRLLWHASSENENDFHLKLARRCARVPMSHILGKRSFFENDFHVSEAVLDPRPETETLVVAALENDFQNVLDLGTGSGCILLSLLAKREKAKGLGVDASAEALEIAKKNADELGLSSRCELLQSNWFEAVTGQFDLIVSNPPYITASEMAGLQPEVREHEPRMALTDEGDGLGAFREICGQVNPYLSPSGTVLFEIGPTQAKEVMALMQTAGLRQLEILQDLDGRDRVVRGHKAP